MAPRTTAPDPVGRDLAARTFVPVVGLTRTAPARTAPAPPEVEPTPRLDIPLAAVDPPDAWDSRVSLFGEPER
jgi:hypothetical protein